MSNVLHVVVRRPFGGYQTGGDFLAGESVSLHGQPYSELGAQGLQLADAFDQPFYAIVHFTLDQAEAAFGEMRRALVPGGYLLLTFHIGDGPVHTDEFLGQRVSADFTLFQPDDVIQRLEAAGLQVEEVTIRYPYKDVAVDTKRAYILARKPATAPPAKSAAATAR